MIHNTRFIGSVRELSWQPSYLVDYFYINLSMMTFTDLCSTWGPHQNGPLYEWPLLTFTVLGVFRIVLCMDDLYWPLQYLGSSSELSFVWMTCTDLYSTCGPHQNCPLYGWPLLTFTVLGVFIRIVLCMDDLYWPLQYLGSSSELSFVWMTFTDLYSTWGLHQNCPLYGWPLLTFTVLGVFIRIVLCMDDLYSTWGLQNCPLYGWPLLTFTVLGVLIRIVLCMDDLYWPLQYLGSSSEWSFLWWPLLTFTVLGVFIRIVLCMDDLYWPLQYLGSSLELFFVWMTFTDLYSTWGLHQNCPLYGWSLLTFTVLGVLIRIIPTVVVMVTAPPVPDTLLILTSEFRLRTPSVQTLCKVKDNFYKMCCGSIYALSPTV